MRLSKRFYLGAPLLLMVAGGLLVAVSGDLDPDSVTLANPRLLVPSLLNVAIQLRLVYVAWAAIQDGFARTSPRKAAGLLLVPGFNLYWLFQVTWGFAKDFNAHVRRRSLAIPPQPAGLYLLFAALFSSIVVVNLFGIRPPALFSLSFVLMYFGLVASVCDAVNALASARVAPATARRSAEGDYLPPGQVETTAAERRLHLLSSAVLLGEFGVLFGAGVGVILLVAGVAASDRSPAAMLIGAVFLGVSGWAWFRLRAKKRDVKSRLTAIQKPNPEQT